MVIFHSYVSLPQGKHDKPSTVGIPSFGPLPRHQKPYSPAPRLRVRRVRRVRRRRSRDREVHGRHVRNVGAFGRLHIQGTYGDWGYHACIVVVIV
jgi:hypothetical protein